AGRNDHGGRQANKLGSQHWQPTELVICPPEFHLYIPALDIAGVRKTLIECSHVAPIHGERTRVEEPDHRHRLGPRPRRERPRSCTAEQRDELAAPHSITSSARAGSVSGTVRPIAFAVLRLITSSYLVGACTGRSAGFSPLRMRST